MNNFARLIKSSLIGLSCTLLLALSAIGAQAADADKPAVTVFTNVKVFNGTDNKLIDADVLVEGNLIKKVGKNLNADGATVIDGGWRQLCGHRRLAGASRAGLACLSSISSWWSHGETMMASGGVHA
jgi:hypothetical protein